MVEGSRRRRREGRFQRSMRGMVTRRWSRRPAAHRVGWLGLKTWNIAGVVAAVGVVSHERVDFSSP